MVTPFSSSFYKAETGCHLIGAWEGVVFPFRRRSHREIPDPELDLCFSLGGAFLRNSGAGRPYGISTRGAFTGCPFFVALI